MAGAVFHSHITSNATEEIKLDGYRAVAANLKGKVSLVSRKRKSFRGQYPYIIAALSDLPENTIVDGDIVALDDVGGQISACFNILAVSFLAQRSGETPFHDCPRSLRSFVLTMN